MGWNDQRLEFADLRSTHLAFLKFVTDGLLLNAPRVVALVLAILKTCVRFASQIERWGGDVLPDLLAEGSTESKENIIFNERNETITTLVVELRDQLRDFFEYITEGDAAFSNGVGGRSDASFASMSLLAAHLPSMPGGGAGAAARRRAPADEARIDMGASAREHLTQLSLRLDYSGFFTGTNLAAAAA